MQAQTKTSSINIVTSTFYKPPTCNYRCSSILVKYAVDIQFNKTFTAVQLVFLISCKTFQRLYNFAFAQNVPFQPSSTMMTIVGWKNMLKVSIIDALAFVELHYFLVHTVMRF